MEQRLNFISRDLVIKAPRDRVWQAVIDPDTMAKWFFNSWRGDWKVGGLVWLHFDGFGEAPIVVTEISDQRFAFKWNRTSVEITEPTDADMQLHVVFTAEEDASGTRLKVLETGYENMNEADYASEFPDHEEGWTSELGELVAWAESGA